MEENYGLNELIMVGVSDIEISKDLHDLLLEIKPGSIILTLGFFRGLRKRFDSKTPAKEFIKKFCKMIHELLPGVLISCDHEGGMIQNFAPPDFTLIPPFRSIGEQNNKKDAYLVGEIMAKELNSVGVDWVFGPVIDCASNPQYYYRMFGRTLSDDPKVCGRLGNEMIKAIQANGMISCVKHYPNMGSSTSDSHKERPDINSSEDDFFKIDLFPFQKANECGVMSMMTNHARYVNIDDTTCATFSKIINIEVLRKKMNFKGVLLTDDLGMGGIYNGEKLDPTTVCQRALVGGCDVLMYSFDVNRARVAYYGLLDIIKKKGDEELLNRVLESVERVKIMKEMHFRNRKEKSFGLDVLHCEEHLNIVKRIGYTFGETRSMKKDDRKMTVGMNCSKEEEEEEEEVVVEKEEWGCNIL